MEKLKNLKDTKLIKVITGIRRCGKSTLLQMYRDYLLSIGVHENQLMSINFEDMDYAELTDAEKLHAYIKKKLVPNSHQAAVSNSNPKYYIFLDEIQNVIDFPKVINSLNTRSNIDLYITGSNAYLLSSELATFLSGRYVEIRMLPLSFKEYLSAVGNGEPSIENFGNERDTKNLGNTTTMITSINTRGLRDGMYVRSAFNDYVRYSSFPYAVVLRDKPEVLKDYLQGIYSTVLIKDVVTRSSISDVMMLESVVRFLFDRVGNLISTKKIADTMSSAGRKISSHTIEKYIRALLGSFIFYRAGRFDVKGREHLKTLEKYYCADIGLRYLLLGSRAGDMGFVLENIIYLELIRRENEVYVGRIAHNRTANREIDFVTFDERDESGYTYYQVAATVQDQKTLERELAPLLSLDDHYPKFIITLDEDVPADYRGIRIINALDFLLQP